MLIPIVIVIIMLFALFYATNNDIQYGISLIDADIPEGTDAILHYEIGVGWLTGQKDNVKFKYHIVGETEEQDITIGDMKTGEKKEATITLDTSDLSHGKYTIMTVLEYWISGNGYTKFLTLELTIY